MFTFEKERLFPTKTVRIYSLKDTSKVIENLEFPSGIVSFDLALNGRFAGEYYKLHNTNTSFPLYLLVAGYLPPEHRNQRPQSNNFRQPKPTNTNTRISEIFTREGLRERRTNNRDRVLSTYAPRRQEPNREQTSPEYTFTSEEEKYVFLGLDLALQKSLSTIGIIPIHCDSELVPQIHNKQKEHLARA